jgi:hypothetical protein
LGGDDESRAPNGRRGRRYRRVAGDAVHSVSVVTLTCTPGEAAVPPQLGLNRPA